jgi:hypothetical protein
MKLIFSKSLSFILLFLTISAFGQQVLENNPSSVKWKQIKTPGFKVIYQDGFDETANDVANTLEHIRQPESETMGKKAPKRISIILQNNNSISNGFVTLGPRRSEFYTLPPQDYNFAGTNKWLDLLAVHEYRHIVQFQRSRTGFNNIFYYLFGENTQAGMAFTAVPKWFWEGDATVMETAITQSGRGRIPSFDRVFRANLLEGKRINYHKQYLRSYKDFIPDHYRMGYYMVAHLRRRTKNPEVWNDISKSAFSTPFIPFTFSNAMKKHTGHFVVENYNMMMDDLAKEWESQLDGLELTSFENITKRKNDTYTDYAFPQILEDGSIVAFKSGLGDMGQLVRIDVKGNQTSKFITGVMNNTGMLSATQFKVYWNENEFNPRWRAKTYSVIKSYDFITKEVKRITSKSRYTGAAVSPDGYKIGTIVNTTDNKNYLVILDALSGKEIKRFDNSENAELGMPRWSKNGNKLVVLKITDQGKSVISINAATGEESVLIETGDENIGYPVLTDDFLFYNSPFNGIDNIYAKNLSTGIRYQVTSSKYGAYNPSIGTEYIIYNEHTVDGLSVVKAPYAPSTWTPLVEVEDRNVNYIAPIVEQEGLGDLLQNRPDTQYESKKYSKLGHMINIHSWGPFASTDLNTAQFGIFSRDVLSTTNTTLGYTYDITEDTGFASAGISYQGWYPIIDFKYDIGSRKTSTYKWDETTINTGVNIPLLLTRNRFSRTLTISNSVGIRQISNFRQRSSEGGRERFINIQVTDNGVPVDTVNAFFVDGRELDNGEFIFNNFSLTFTNLMKRAPRNIQSRWGQFLVFEQFSAVGGEFEGALTGFRGALYFPSPINLFTNEIFKNHSLNSRFGYQKRKVDPIVNLYSFRNVVFKPRGYSYDPTEESFYSILTNYEFPLLYPDLSLGPFLYIKRIKANIFYDYGRETVITNVFFNEDIGNFNIGDFWFANDSKNTYASVGAELTFDFNIMRFPIDIEMGIRYVNTQSTSNNNGGSSFEVIFAGINF